MSDEQKKPRSARKKRYYVGYQYNPKTLLCYKSVIVEGSGAPDLEALQAELEKVHKTANLIIISCFETK